ncbi:MAG: twin arginine-targeting protein translocase TatB [Candidatus Sedimenticola endophacoides]|uniref:Sec-independent protein translocase protein TatB n=1 Tax=Candidatus Sedimenticola endophacoides TaxID=2548426 RepID=A0A657PQR2_9GAMM|nr:MAG: twin arginine-targeting protein translocase TatB [Candidatus Sedimenticola endophacoides]
MARDNLFELLLLGLVALLVVGPERLPKLAYTAGKWLGKGRSMINSVKLEIDKEIKAEEVKQILEEQRKKLNPLEEVIEETTSVARDLGSETAGALNSARQAADDPSGAAAPASSEKHHDKPE